ncbi:MAG TPA: DUF305 domain-containing protein [Azospirillum sp.]
MERRWFPQFAASVVLSMALASSPVLAQGQSGQPAHGHSGGMMQGQGMAEMPKDPASRAYMQTMQKMNQDMGKPMTGNADRDFATMMIAHHQGAIDMARVELEHGKDPELKKMAQKVIDDQTKEIKELQDWLGRHPPQAAQK